MKTRRIAAAARPKRGAGGVGMILGGSLGLVAVAALFGGNKRNAQAPAELGAAEDRPPGVEELGRDYSDGAASFYHGDTPEHRGAPFELQVGDDDGIAREVITTHGEAAHVES